MRLNLERVLKALGRFDSATVAEVAEGVGRNNESQQRNVWHLLQRCVKMGYAQRINMPGTQAVYQLTEVGREKARTAA